MNIDFDDSDKENINIFENKNKNEVTLNVIQEKIDNMIIKKLQNENVSLKLFILKLFDLI